MRNHAFEFGLSGMLARNSRPLINLDVAVIKKVIKYRLTLYINKKMKTLHINKKLKSLIVSHINYSKLD